MAYQILLGLEQRLSCQYKILGKGESRTLTHTLQRRAAADTARIGAALRWALEPSEPDMKLEPRHGELGKLCKLGKSWEDFFARPASPPGPENVVVICGPAHVQELGHRLEAALGRSQAARRFLAKNAGLFPRLLINSTWSWERLSADAMLDGLQSHASSFDLHSVGAASPRSQGDGFGPLASLAAIAASALEGSSPLQTPGTSAVHAGPACVHERLRSLSQRPLPVWPVFLVLYVIAPVMVFLVIPIMIDIRWLQARIAGPEFPDTLREEKQMPLKCQQW